MKQILETNLLQEVYHVIRETVSLSLTYKCEKDEYI